jgi:FtsH-binding integral membrane protein
MAEFKPMIATGFSSGSPISDAEAAAIDAGLRGYMLRIYNYMGLGLAVTGMAALATYWLSVAKDPDDAAKVVRGSTEIPIHLAGNLYLTPLGYAVFIGPLRWLVILSPLALVIGLSFGLERLRPATAQVLFWVYAALVGLSLGSFFMLYTQTSVGPMFFITAASFAALSLWGYSTRCDLTAMRSFMVMGVFGIVIAGLVNMFLASSVLHWTLSLVGVLAFAGLTASDAQRLKNEYIYGAIDGDIAERSAISGALSLYLDFVNLFALLLQLQGSRED